MATTQIPDSTAISAAGPQKLSILHGPVDPPLVDLTLGELLELQAAQQGGDECLVMPWTGARWTYHDLHQQSSLLAQALLTDLGMAAGDRVGIMAGNCEQYAAVFFAVAKMGAILVILNNTYTPAEALYVLRFSGCKVLFTTMAIGRLDNAPLLTELARGQKGEKGVEVVLLRGEVALGLKTYDDLVRCSLEDTGLERRRQLQVEMARVLPHQVVNLQFTSGTTGRPKAAMLTHHNLVNNSRFIGDRMRLTPDDVLCCPPPLFHCFGLVLGLLAVVTHGSKIVFPAEVFDAAATLRAIAEEGCTGVHGVPAMFDSLLQEMGEGGSQSSSSNRSTSDNTSNKIIEPPPRLRLRTGIIAGAPVARHLMEQLVARFGMREFTSSYGLTEASPTCFNAFTDDAVATRLATVGTLMPHAHAKLVDAAGRTVPLGRRGELCVAGYQLQAGYWDNAEKTAEVMVRDDDGVLWLRTGDEAVFDERGYCTITGRFKDIIIRGGENIYPLEIEERLTAHPAISRAIVVGLEDTHYGEVVGAFIEQQQRPQMQQQKGAGANEEAPERPNDDEVRSWVREKLGHHKAPAHVLWLGDGGVPAEVPLTGSGKVRKFEMARLGNEILARRRARSQGGVMSKL